MSYNEHAAIPLDRYDSLKSKEAELDELKTKIREEYWKHCTIVRSTTHLGATYTEYIYSNDEEVNHLSSRVRGLELEVTELTQSNKMEKKCSDTFRKTIVFEAEERVRLEKDFKFWVNFLSSICAVLIIAIIIFLIF